jgi:CBS domain-containing protein
MKERVPMLARDIMTRDVIFIHDDASAQDVIRRLAEYQISGMPVLNRQKRLVGIVTEADVIGRSGDHISDIMTRRVITVAAETPVDRIAQIITSNRIKRVIVVEGPQVIGVVSRADIVRMMASRWTCGVCGAIHLGAQPEVCDACGAPGHIFGRQLDSRPEITSR